MKRVYKYPLSILDEQRLTLPAKSSVLSVCEQEGNIMLYALIEDNQPNTEEWIIRIAGTGHEIADAWIGKDFVGAVKLADDALVFHVFALMPYPHTRY